MSALRDGETVKFEVSPNDTVNTYSDDIDTSGTTKIWTDYGHVRKRASFWRRLWFLVSCVPRYLITGSVEIP